jgi:chorismate mutase
MNDIIAIQNWGLWPSEKFLLIGGPCSVESPEQLKRTLMPLANSTVSMVRGGIWKPRTRPGAFEGLGEEALIWLKASKSYTKLPICIEVASPKHVELALQHEVDVLWIGARSTANPFTVQEIADSLAGSSLPVMVKNPVNPELSLWIGAIERIYRSGCRKIAAIHRGFTPYSRSEFRNPPIWEIAMELKNTFPTLSLICDPSHITGKREALADMSQLALDLGYEGLMIETHFDPDNALTDARQQISPESLLHLVENLNFRNNQNPEKELAGLRAQIDQIDQELLETLRKRLSICRQIGRYKKQNNIAIYQPSRWREISESRPNLAGQLGLDPSWVRQLFTLIHSESIEVQEQIMRNDN